MKYLLDVDTCISLFGPVKYAYLPQHLHEDELTGGSGMVEMGTFLAILLGTMTGGALVGLAEAGPAWVAAVTVALAIIGRVTAGFVPYSPGRRWAATRAW